MGASRAFLALAFVAGVPATALLACSSDEATTPTADAGPDVIADAADAGQSDAPVVLPEDAAKRNCQLDNGSDPVALCTQKDLLRLVHEAVWAPDTGVFASWNSTTNLPDGDGGTKTHDVRDDLAWGAATTAYGLSATRYGDTELTPTLDKDLVELVPLLKQELASLPAEYSGEPYRHLRDVAVGLRYLNANDDANAMDTFADAYGKQVFAHFVALTGSDGVLAENATNQDYAPGDVATGALALLDMAVRHTSDDPTNAAKWIAAARASLDHIYDRAREPGTKMYYGLLVPSAAAGHDDLSPRAAAPQDALLTDTTATVALALLRASELVTKNAKALADLASYPFAAHANEAIASVNGTPTPNLYDNDLGYMEGWVPSTGTTLTNKPTRANALMFAAIHRANVDSVSPFAKQLKPLRTVMVARSPANSSLLSASLSQAAYFREVSREFTVLEADAGVPLANSYFTSAVLIACEGLTEQIYGVP